MIGAYPATTCLLGKTIESRRYWASAVTVPPLSSGTGLPYRPARSGARTEDASPWQPLQPYWRNSRSPSCCGVPGRSRRASQSWNSEGGITTTSPTMPEWDRPQYSAQ